MSILCNLVISFFCDIAIAFSLAKCSPLETPQTYTDTNRGLKRAEADPLHLRHLPYLLQKRDDRRLTVLP